jgi:hypothetical protein
LLLIFPTIFFISTPALENGFTNFLQIFPKKNSPPSLHHHLQAP